MRYPAGCFAGKPTKRRVDLMRAFPRPNTRIALPQLTPRVQLSSAQRTQPARHKKLVWRVDRVDPPCGLHNAKLLQRHGANAGEKAEPIIALQDLAQGGRWLHDKS
jgi:hypothetical protein